MYDLAIVGLGATGISLLKQLHDQVRASGLRTPRIAVFNPSREFGRGNAFGGADAIHKVNTPPEMLSVSEFEPVGFQRWMESKGDAKSRFPHRLRYSDFLSETYNLVLQSGVLDLLEVREPVIAMEKSSGCFLLRTASRNISANKAILCLGSLHGSNFRQMSQATGFFNGVDEFNIDDTLPVVVAGTGLTAIDIFRTLDKDKNRQIHLFSRNGIAPTCLTAAATYSPRFVTWTNLLHGGPKPLRLERFVELLDEERDRMPGGSEREPAQRIMREQGLAQYFEYLMNRSREACLPYQDTLISTRPFMHELWRSFSIEDRLSFQRDLGADWAAWRHPIPYEVISELKSAATDGRLQIHKSTSIEHVSGNFTLTTSTGLKVRAPYFIDGTGGTNRLDAIDSSLISSLVYGNLISPHPCGGISVDPLTFTCQVNGKPVNGLYCIGPLGKGSLFSTNAHWFNTRCAGHWARQWTVEALVETAKAA